MGDHASTTNPNESAIVDKGKGKAQDPTQDQNMESESESESELELPENDEDDDDTGDLEPISQENIISGGRRTRGKQINWDKVNADAMDDEEDDDEDYKGAGDDNDDQMRD
ncbi:Histone H2A.Z-specific chaperone chz1 [Penicillium sp. IBT 18751x]|nr:Histone H2A.Z-specific chaperone chz1 [Penicillium sp. IBT 18751x]